MYEFSVSHCGSPLVPGPSTGRQVGPSPPAGLRPENPIRSEHSPATIRSGRTHIHGSSDPLVNSSPPRVSFTGEGSRTARVGQVVENVGPRKESEDIQQYSGSGSRWRRRPVADREHFRACLTTHGSPLRANSGRGVGNVITKPGRCTSPLTSSPSGVSSM